MRVVLEVDDKDDDEEAMLMVLLMLLVLLIVRLPALQTEKNDGLTWCE